jgi:hypothetical protein
MIYKVYFGLPNLRMPILLHKAINRVYLLIFKKLFNKRFVKQLQSSMQTDLMGINKIKRDLIIDVSITSFPARIEEVCYTIETLFLQTVKVDSITVWLSVDQFPEREIPTALKLQKARGLSIKFVEDDLRSHKKYYYSFLEQKDNIIITFDDDVYYPKNTIEKLINAHKMFPKAVICNRGHKINFKGNQVLKYKNWSHNFRNSKPTFDLVPTGVGGVLYPPNSYHKDVFDIKTFKETCFFADDLWLKVQTLRKGTKVLGLKTFSRDLINVGKSQDFKLAQHNAVKGGNNEQFEKILNHYSLTKNDFKDET